MKMETLALFALELLLKTERAHIKLRFPLGSLVPSVLSTLFLCSEEWLLRKPQT